MIPRARAAAVAALLLSIAAEAGAQQGPAGLWETVSDSDGKPKAHVRIVDSGGELRGTVEEILDPAKRADLCNKCTDERASKPVLGMTILTGMHPDGDAWSGGRILDPNNGKVYSCRMELVDGGRHLKVRGFIGIALLGRTQTWNRLADSH